MSKSTFIVPIKNAMVREVWAKGTELVVAQGPKFALAPACR